MYHQDGEEIFVIDGHVHLWDATEENIVHRGGEEFIQCFYKRSRRMPRGLTPGLNPIGRDTNH